MRKHVRDMTALPDKLACQLRYLIISDQLGYCKLKCFPEFTAQCTISALGAIRCLDPLPSGARPEAHPSLRLRKRKMRTEGRTRLRIRSAERTTSAPASAIICGSGRGVSTIAHKKCKFGFRLHLRTFLNRRAHQFAHILLLDLRLPSDVPIPAMSQESHAAIATCNGDPLTIHYDI